MDIFYHNLILLAEFFKQPRFFLSCTEIQWQAYLQKFSFGKLNLAPSVGDFMNVTQILAFTLDSLMYLLLGVAILQFGLLYNKGSTNWLLMISSKHIKIFVSSVFVLLCFHLLFLSSVAPRFTFIYLGGLYIVNYPTQLVKLGLLVLWLSLNMFVMSLATAQSQGIAEFPISSYLVLCFSFTMLSAGDLALLFICLEGFSLTLYIMATVNRLQGGIVAATKYFAFGTAGSVLILWGLIHLYEITSSLSVGSVSYLFEFSWNYYNLVSLKAEWAATVILVGFLIKLGAAPVHQWVPDVYAGVSLLVTAFFAIFVKFILFMLFIKLAYIFTTSLEAEYAALTSLVVGCFGTLRQVEIKRFLAYSSITHMGFLLAGDLNASLIYLLTYLVSSFIFFSVLLNLKLCGREFIYLSDLRYLASGRQWDRLLLVLSLASMAGLPPFAGFYGKMFVWVSLLEDIYLFNDFLSYTMLVVNLLASLLIILYYMRVIIIIYLGDEQKVRLSSYTLAVNVNRAELLIIHSTQYTAALLLGGWTVVCSPLLSMLIVFTESLSL